MHYIPITNGIVVVVVAVKVKVKLTWNRIALALAALMRNMRYVRDSTFKAAFATVVGVGLGDLCGILAARVKVPGSHSYISFDVATFN